MDAGVHMYFVVSKLHDSREDPEDGRRTVCGCGRISGMSAQGTGSITGLDRAERQAGV